MPKPVRSDQTYLPGLDGLRALAVAAVVAYHLGYGWAQGGLLGVGVFFTLSGYLITDILVGQWAANGRIKLADFWLRRARRLLPALFVVLAVVTVWVNFFARSFLPGYRGDVVASVFYVNNWWYIDQHSSYYARFAPPAPLDHLWSLAVEEQFYLVWPWAVLLLVWLTSLARRRRRKLTDSLSEPSDHGSGHGSSGAPYLTWPSRLAIAAAALGLAAGSALLMNRFYQPGYDPTRVYEGTDTRAFGLLIGAALAIVWPTRGFAAGGKGREAPPVPRGDAPPNPPHGPNAIAAASPGKPAARTIRPVFRRLIDVAGLAGLVVIVGLVWRTNEYSGFMFRSGLVLLSVATAAAVAAAATPGSLIGLALGWRPLRWIGVRSYGIYLWHYPLIVLTTAAGAAGAPVSPLRAAALVAGTVAAAAVSWHFIESPIRRGVRPSLVMPWKTTQWKAVSAQIGRTGMFRSPVTVGAVCLLGATLVAAGVTLSARLTAAGAATAANVRLSHPAGRPGGAPALTLVARPTKTAATAHSAAHSASHPTTHPTPAASAPLRTSCESVVHVGDSTSEGLISADYEPNPANRITARYADVGVKRSIMKIVGATSVVESLPGTPNAYQMASEVKQSGFHGCWVLALGTNDTADVYAGSNVDRAQRIEKMMSLIGNQPVMWVEVTSLLSSGPYSEQNMQLWNEALQQLQPRYPNMRIYNWPAVVQKSWFISDGIHYTTVGYAHRAQDIADALAVAFPAS
jgi:peptidoglycan/LPS O-acetylase OafA/YrhL